MSIKILTPDPVVYTSVPDKEGVYKLGDPKCEWCDSNKNIYKNETTGKYCCGDCKK